MDKTKNRKIFSVIGKIMIILVFAAITITTAKAHEPWSDEAQSFLIAKDSSFKEIFTQAKYEGTTPLWFLIIKFFLLIGGSYETFFILPIFFSILGVIILEFKVKAPWYIKLLLPFTYFILFQYSVVARSYCMLFPALMWIASVYRDRGEHLISYCLALLFLMSICSFSMVIASSLFLIELFFNLQMGLINLS